MKLEYNKSIIALAIAGTNVMIGFGLFISFLPYYATLLGASIGIQIGIITSSFMIARGFLVIPFGKLSDKIGRKKLIVIGLIIYAISTILFPIASDWTHVAVFRSLQGVGAAMFWPSSAALIADLIKPGSRGTALSIFNTGVMLGLIIGPAFGGIIQYYGYNILGLSEIESYKLPFYVGTLFAFISALIVIFFVKEKRQLNTSLIEPSSNKSIQIAKKFKSTFNSLLALRFAHGFGLSFIQPVLAMYIYEVIGLDRVVAVLWLSSAFFLSGLCGSLIQFPIGRLADKGYRKQIIILGGILSAIFTVAIPSTSIIILIVVIMGIRSACHGTLFPTIASTQEDLMPKKVRGKLTGITEAYWTAGAIIGPIVGFYVYEYNPAFPFYLSAILIVITIAIYTRFGKDPKVTESEI